MFERFALRIVRFSNLFSPLGILCLVFTSVLANDVKVKDVSASLLPDKIGDLRGVNSANAPSDYASTGEEFEKELVVTRTYRSAKGDTFVATLVRTRTDRGAYSLFSTELQKLLIDRKKVDGLGTVAAIDSAGRLVFFKGQSFVTISNNGRVKDAQRMIAFARLLAEPLDKGDGEIPVLVKHLPEWEAKLQNTVYSISLPTLQDAAGQRPVLNAVNFSGGAEAVTALYDTSRLVIVELTTPQLATDNDARINARINELRSGGQPVPSAYRRVGNYAVFVFDAPSETVATQLMDRIAYEQVVQWLGDNPNWLIRAEREYRQTTAGVILAVFKASGLSLLICLAIGGIFGSIVFRRRRAQQATTEAYSDAGGMLRLNIDKMTPEVNPARLLGKNDG